MKGEQLGSNADLCVGDEVMLSEDHNWNHLSTSNPIGVVGRVDDIDSGWVYVQWGWSSNIHNCYKLVHSDLIKV